MAIGLLVGAGLLTHNPDGLVVRELAGLVGRRSVGWVVVGGLGLGLEVVLFLDAPLGAVVCFFLGPGEGDGAEASGCLDYLFVGLAVEIGIISNVFVEHLNRIIAVV